MMISGRSGALDTARIETKPAKTKTKIGKRNFTRNVLLIGGHMQPLRAKPGGVLERIGQTEAAKLFMMGSEFMPPLYEGSLLYMPTAPPGRGAGTRPRQSPPESASTSLTIVLA